MGKINPRTKGHAFERYLAEKFRVLGFLDCLTSRLESKRQDDLGIDLCHTGKLQIQAKANEKLGPCHDILAKMPKNGKWNFVFHKRNRKGVTVSLSEEHFFEIAKLLIDNNLI